MVNGGQKRKKKSYLRQEKTAAAHLEDGIKRLYIHLHIYIYRYIRFSSFEFLKISSVAV